MPIYHCSIKIGGRSKGQSAVAAASYRSGEKLKDAEIGAICDYSKKKGVIHSEVSLCKNAPSGYADRETLWNAVHKIEKARNAQLWREIEIAIPREFTPEEQIKAVREYVKGLVDDGMCADWNIHDKGDGNPHAHIMLTTRPIKGNGQWGDKEKKDYKKDKNGEKIPIIDPKTGLQKVDARNCKQWERVLTQANDWNSRDRAEVWREQWATVCNRRLETGQKIDHRSYVRQKKEQMPTIHEGYVAREIKAAGSVSDRCTINENIKALNLVKSTINKITDFEEKYKNYPHGEDKPALVRAAAAPMGDTENDKKKTELPKTQPAATKKDNAPVSAAESSHSSADETKAETQTFEKLISARNEFYRQSVLFADAPPANSIKNNVNNVIEFVNKLKNAANTLVPLIQSRDNLFNKIRKCIPIVYKQEKSELKAKCDKVIQEIKDAFNTLIAGDMPEYQNNVRLYPDTLTENNAREMVRLATQYKIPEAERKAEAEISKINRYKAAQGINQWTIETAYKNFQDECKKIPPEHREAAYNALSKADLYNVCSGSSPNGFTAMVTTKKKIEKTLISILAPTRDATQENWENTRKSKRSHDER